MQKDQGIYDRIYGAIVEQWLAPGTKLGEEALCEAFGVSRTRIRRVLLRLAHGNVVELRPNRGAYVARPSVEDARDVFEARRAIEATILRRAVQDVTDDQIARLRDIVRADDEALVRGNRNAAIKSSGEFHLMLAEIAGNRALHKFLRELVSQTSLIIALYGGARTFSCSHDDHGALIAGLEARDADLALRVMDDHLRHIEGLLDLSVREEKRVSFKAIFDELAAAS